MIIVIRRMPRRTNPRSHPMIYLYSLLGLSLALLCVAAVAYEISRTS